MRTVHVARYRLEFNPLGWWCGDKLLHNNYLKEAKIEEEEKEGREDMDDDDDGDDDEEERVR